LLNIVGTDGNVERQGASGRLIVRIELRVASSEHCTHTTDNATEQTDTSQRPNTQVTCTVGALTALWSRRRVQNKKDKLNVWACARTYRARAQALSVAQNRLLDGLRSVHGMAQVREGVGEVKQVQVVDIIISRPTAGSNFLRGHSKRRDVCF
jgi:hypothetical protein